MAWGDAGVTARAGALAAACLAATAGVRAHAQEGGPLALCEALDIALDAAARGEIERLAARSPGAAGAPPPPFAACARVVRGFPGECVVEASPFGAGWTLTTRPATSGPRDAAAAPAAPADPAAWAEMVAACAGTDVFAPYEPPWPAGAREIERIGFTARGGRARILITALGEASAVAALTLIVEAHSPDAVGARAEAAGATPDLDGLLSDHEPLRRP